LELNNQIFFTKICYFKYRIFKTSNLKKNILERQNFFTKKIKSFNFFLY
jgi:hypothetical protein